jgi:pyroglutamyl-peptidase
LPVEFDTAYNVLRDAYDPEQHGTVLIFGLGSQASRAANIETRARNLDYSLLYADNAGKRRVGNVIKGAEWSLPTTADTTAIKQGIESTGVRARFSRDAGTYVCNHVLYSALHDFDASVGFVHLAKRMNHDEVVATVRGSVRALKG